MKMLQNENCMMRHSTDENGLQLFEIYIHLLTYSNASSRLEKRASGWDDAGVERKIEVNENFVKLATCHARFIIGIRKDLDMESLREIYAKIHSAKFIIIHFLLLLLLIYSA
jgi:hypothetical protein